MSMTWGTMAEIRASEGFCPFSIHHPAYNCGRDLYWVSGFQWAYCAPLDMYWRYSQFLRVLPAELVNLLTHEQLR